MGPGEPGPGGVKPPRLLAVGRLKPGPEDALFAQYNARLRPPFAVTELAEARGSAGEVRAREGAALLAALPPQAFLVALDLGGETPSSEALAMLATRWEATGRLLCFVIGGAEGLELRRQHGGPALLVGVAHRDLLRQSVRVGVGLRTREA